MTEQARFLPTGDIGSVSNRTDLAHYTHRMLQALDGYWEHCEGLSDRKLKTVRSFSTAEDWWCRFEKYRAKVEALIGVPS